MGGRDLTVVKHSQPGRHLCAVGRQRAADHRRLSCLGVRTFNRPDPLHPAQSCIYAVRARARQRRADHRAGCSKDPAVPVIIRGEAVGFVRRLFLLFGSLIPIYYGLRRRQCSNRSFWSARKSPRS